MSLLVCLGKRAGRGTMKQTKRSARVVQVVENSSYSQQLITQTTVEAFDEGIRRRFAKGISQRGSAKGDKPRG